MTLSRQMLALILLLLLLMLIGSWGVHLINTRSFLQQQLQSHATDTATALSLSLAPSLEPFDTPLVNSTLDAIYDHGFFARITLVDNQGDVLAERQASPSQIEVPDWFQGLYSFTPPTAEMALKSGWRLVGNVRVQSSVAPAYQTLWQAGWQFIGVALIALVVALLVGALLLRKIMRPLKAIEQHAEQIAHHQFDPLPFTPRTRELRQVVTALNQMAESLSRLFSGLNRKAQRLQQQSYLDPDTGLGNRRRFIAEMQRRVGDEQAGYGVLLVCHLELEFVRKRDGYLAAKQLLQGVIETLKQGLKSTDTALLYRLNDYECAALLPHQDQPQAEQIAQQIALYLQDEDQTDLENGLGYIGLSYYHTGDCTEQVLSDMDLALATARGMGANRYHFNLGQDRKRHPLLNFAQRKQLLEGLLSEKRVELSRQAILRMPSGKPVYFEYRPRFVDAQKEPLASDTVYATALQAERLGELERMITSEVLEQARGDEAGFGFKLSPHTLLNDSYVHWLCSYCRAHPRIAEQLVIELDESLMGGATDKLLVPLQHLQQAGVRVAIDHFGRHGTAFSRLSQIRPAYIRVDGCYSCQLQDHLDHQFYMQTLQQMAHGLRAQVIATRVATEVDQMELLRQGITLMQGDSVRKTEELNAPG